MASVTIISPKNSLQYAATFACCLALQWFSKERIRGNSEVLKAYSAIAAITSWGNKNKLCSMTCGKELELEHENFIERGSLFILKLKPEKTKLLHSHNDFKTKRALLSGKKGVTHQK